MQRQSEHNLEENYKKMSSLLVFLLKRTWWTLPSLLIIICVMINIFQMIPYKIIPGSTDAWLGFWGAIIGAFLSVIITLFVMLYTLSSDADVRLHEKLEIIVANNSNLKDILILDGYKCLEKIDSKVYIEFFNLGKSGIYDINYTFSIDDLDSIISTTGIHYFKTDKNIFFVEYDEDINGKNEKKELRYINDEFKVMSPSNNILLEGDSIKVDLPKELLFLLLLLSEEKDITLKILFKLNYKNFQKKEVINNYTFYFNKIRTTKHPNNTFGWNKYFISGTILTCQGGEIYE